MRDWDECFEHGKQVAAFLLGVEGVVMNVWVDENLRSVR
jgi:hypothetical protein